MSDYDNPCTVEKQKKKIGSSGQEIESKWVKVQGKDLNECKKIFDKTWSDE